MCSINHILPIQSIYDEYYKKYITSPKLEMHNRKNNTISAMIGDFALPITYLNAELIHSLSSTVANDLELTQNYPIVREPDVTTHSKSPNSSQSTSMYDYVFQPKHDFAKQMSSQWVKQYTTNIPHLIDTQTVIKNSQQYLKNMTVESPEMIQCSQSDCENLTEIWSSVKNDADFLEKYHYMDWEILKYLNNSADFLQTVSIINIMSPLLSLLIPVIFLVFPFVIMQIQGLSISFSGYIAVLKEIARHHFIGKAISNMENMSVESFGYLIIMGLFYGLQIYQNIVSCMRYYRNISRINENILCFHKYINYSIKSMTQFVKLNEGIETYEPFILETEKHIINLQKFSEELSRITEFSNSIEKIKGIGYMMKCFYELRANLEYDQSIRFSFGFEGYINNILGIYENLRRNRVSATTFNIENATVFKKQYYPPYIASSDDNSTENCIKNTCDLNKNIIISGVNASGKTTLLKTTTLNIIFSQQFGCGFFDECSLNPYTHIHSYLNIPDTSGRDSLFQAESRRCKEILDIIKENPSSKAGRYSRHFCIFDELYSGTNPTDATKSAYAFLIYLAKYSHVNIMLTTHYLSVCKKLRKHENFANYKMEVLTNPETGSFKYTYKLKRGISSIQGAVEILKKMNYPAEIIESIENITPTVKKNDTKLP